MNRSLKITLFLLASFMLPANHTLATAVSAKPKAHGSKQNFAGIPEKARLATVVLLPVGIYAVITISEGQLLHSG